MIEIVCVRVRGSSFNEQYVNQKIPLEPGQFCLVETEIGLQIAEVISKPKLMKERFVENKLPKIIRRASDEDLKILEKLKKVELEAFDFCLERISARNLPMKLIRVIFAIDQSKALFMFTADGRIDFRELVRDLAHKYKTRIEMKQVGVRDEARLIGGIGNCGNTLCCVRFLKEFHPVSIKMAKEQGLSLIPSKISGICGRLMCCLQYEHEYYANQIKSMPKVGKRIDTPSGVGRIKQINALKNLVTVEIDGDLQDFTAEEIKAMIQNSIKDKNKSSESAGDEKNGKNGNHKTVSESN